MMYDHTQPFISIVLSNKFGLFQQYNVPPYTGSSIECLELHYTHFRHLYSKSIDINVIVYTWDVMEDAVLNEKSQPRTPKVLWIALQDL